MIGTLDARTTIQVENEVIESYLYNLLPFFSDTKLVQAGIDGSASNLRPLNQYEAPFNHSYV